MNYKDFVERIKLIINESGMAKAESGQKINEKGVMDTYLRLVEEDEPVQVDIFLYPYYMKYAYKKLETTEILHYILKDYLERKFSLNKNFMSIKDNLNQIIFQVVNYDMYYEHLKERPHIKFFDLAIVFSFYITNNLKLFPTIPITNDISMSLGLERDQLFKVAYLNTISLFPYQFRRLGRRQEQIKSNKNASKSNGQLTADFPEEISVFVLTNQIERYGSFHLLYSDIMRKISEELNNDFYIIPYSVNELIIVPKVPELNLEILSDLHNDMIFDFGDGDFLSKKIYFFSKEEKEISELTI